MSNKLSMLYRVMKRGDKYCIVLSIDGVKTRVSGWYNSRREAIETWNKEHNI